MRTNWLVTVAGIMAAMMGVPVAVAALPSSIVIPAWWSHIAFFFVLVGIVGTVLLGWAAKGADVHSTAAQVATSTIDNPQIEQAAKAQAVAKP
jgi:hypothetical protein